MSRVKLPAHLRRLSTAFCSLAYLVRYYFRFEYRLILALRTSYVRHYFCIANKRVANDKKKEKKMLKILVCRFKSNIRRFFYKSKKNVILHPPARLILISRGCSERERLKCGNALHIYVVKSYIKIFCIK